MVGRVRYWALSVLAMVAGVEAAPASAYLFWTMPDFKGAPVTGEEPGIALPLPGAKPNEIAAGLVWNLRAGLNVAALQCQFAPALMTVRNYNESLKQHDGEFDKAQAALGTYFKRKNGKGWQRDFDAYTTRTYNGFSTLHGQIGFCETAGSIGRDAVGAPKGKLYLIAEKRMRELRNSLVPVGDRLLSVPAQTQFATRSIPLDPKCWKRDELKKTCSF